MNLFTSVITTLYYNYLSVCIAAARLVHGVGLVHLPSRLRTAHLEVSAGQPVHCTCTLGEVSIPLSQLLFHYLMLICLSCLKIEDSVPVLM